MDKFTVLAVVGEIRTVEIEAETQTAAETLVLADPRVLIIIDQSEFEELGSTNEVFDEIDDPKDPVAKIH
jgi:hypothetical protein